MFSSECPAWTSFAEKSGNDWLVDKMSQVKTPMMVQADLVRQLYGTYHLSVQPCYDKKIESFRTQGIDLVLSTQEFLQMLKHLAIDHQVQEQTYIDFDSAFEAKLAAHFGLPAQMPAPRTLTSLTDMTSNSYLETIMHFLCQTQHLTVNIK